jgi:hypothetical protein
MLHGPAMDAPDRIHVDAARTLQLAQGFERVWQRPPTQPELDGLVEEFVREEIYYREALAMGLDRDDTIVRRRMRQKLEFLSDDLAPVTEPTMPRSNPSRARTDAYWIEPRVALRQVFVSATAR